jgi:hypothetical protein
LQPLRSAVAEAQEARAQVCDEFRDTDALHCHASTGHRSWRLDQAVVGASCCSRLLLGHCGWLDFQVRCEGYFASHFD